VESTIFSIHSLPDPVPKNNHFTKSPIRVGIAGIGNMGSAHARSILAGNIKNLELAAVCDPNPKNTDQFPEAKQFSKPIDLIHSGEVDAVIIATPHYDHTTMGIEALENGLHTLIEKPISVHKADCERLIAAYNKTKGQKNRPVFAAMFNQRTDPTYVKVRELIQNGELGEIRRVNWIITNWFRTHSYYASGGWRATWAGEGGGVLLNQCPHQLDLFQWLFGMPTTVHAFAEFGKYHDIEVEDDVTSYMEFKNGATGVFISSTGEAPGTNRLEITAERGRVVIENGKIEFLRNEIPMLEFSRTTESMFAQPNIWKVEIPVSSGHGPQHNGILANFADVILDKAKLIAPAQEGIHSVELANAMLLSAFTGKTIKLPLNGRLYERHLKEKIKNSKPTKKNVRK